VRLASRTSLSCWYQWRASQATQASQPTTTTHNAIPAGLVTTGKHARFPGPVNQGRSGAGIRLDQGPPRRHPTTATRLSSFALSVHLHRPAVGEWVCLDASTTIGIPGVGLAESRLWDVHGPIGRSVQSLLVEPRA